MKDAVTSSLSQKGEWNRIAMFVINYLVTDWKHKQRNAYFEIFFHFHVVILGLFNNISLAHFI
jgi:hypothetical protein